MIRQSTTARFLRLIPAAVSIAGALCLPVSAQELPELLNAFNAESEIPQWDEGEPVPEGAWESVPTGNVSPILDRALSFSFDPGKDAERDPTDPTAVNPESGALKISADFEVAGAGTIHEWRAMRHFPGGQAYDLSGVSYLTFEVYFDPSSSGRAGGYGFFEVAALLAPEDDGGEPTWVKLPATADGGSADQAPGAASTKWVTIEAPIPTDDPAFERVLGLAVMGAHRAGGASTLWIDDFRLVPVGSEPPTPDPAIAVEPAGPGLLLTADVPDVGDSQNLRTVPGNYSWIGRATAASPVTYSFTIDAYPAQKEFESHIWLIPAAVDGDGAEVPWTSNAQTTHPHALRLTIRNQENGSAWSHVAYKIDTPDGDTFWSSPDIGFGAALGSLSAPSATGTWALEFTSDTTVTLRAPGGVSATWEIAVADDDPDLLADAFGGPMSVYFGVSIHDGQAEHHIGLNSAAYLGSVAIAGVPEPLETDFAAAPDPAVWVVDSSVNPEAVRPVLAGDRPLWIAWNRDTADLPLEESADLAEWLASDATPRTLTADRILVLKTSADPSAPRRFYRLGGLTVSP